MFSVLSWALIPLNNSSICPWITLSFFKAAITHIHYVSSALLPLFSPPSNIGRTHFLLQIINRSGNSFNLINFPCWKGDFLYHRSHGARIKYLIGSYGRKDWTCSLQPLLSLRSIFREHTLASAHCSWPQSKGPILYGEAWICPAVQLYMPV